MIEEKPLNASVPLPRKTGRRVFLAIALTALLIALGGYLWWRPIQAERALEDASMEELTQITTQRPNDARAFYYLGLRYERASPKVTDQERTRQKVAAYDALSRATELAPDEEEIWTALAGAANALKGPKASFSVMNSFLKRHPDSIKMKEERASLLVSLQRASDGFAAAKRYPEAIQYYQIWLEEEPTATSAQQGLQKALQASDSKTESASNAFLTLAKLYEQQGDPIKADEARKQAEQIQRANTAKSNQKN
jgi:tetratricopeptide (TPR) repeat protein